MMIIGMLPSSSLSLSADTVDPAPEVTEGAGVGVAVLSLPAVPPLPQLGHSTPRRRTSAQSGTQAPFSSLVPCSQKVSAVHTVSTMHSLPDSTVPVPQVMAAGVGAELAGAAVGCELVGSEEAGDPVGVEEVGSVVVGSVVGPGVVGVTVGSGVVGAGVGAEDPQAHREVYAVAARALPFSIRMSSQYACVARCPTRSATGPGVGNSNVPVHVSTHDSN